MALTVRVKQAGVDYIAQVARAHGMDRSDYLRGLLEAERSANDAGHSLFIENWRPL